jgi:hypothetical protein
VVPSLRFPHENLNSPHLPQKWSGHVGQFLSIIPHFSKYNIKFAQLSPIT